MRSMRRDQETSKEVEVILVYETEKDSLLNAGRKTATRTASTGKEETISSSFFSTQRDIRRMFEKDQLVRMLLDQQIKALQGYGGWDVLKKPMGGATASRGANHDKYVVSVTVNKDSFPEPKVILHFCKLMEYVLSNDQSKIEKLCGMMDDSDKSSLASLCQYLGASLAITFRNGNGLSQRRPA